MSRDLELLTPEFRVKVDKLILDCEKRGVKMRPFFTARHPEEQGRLWRQSRATWEVNEKISFLRDNGADYLADCIEHVGPQSGKWATNAIPGYSWHQWGEAIDCFWLLDGKSEWSTSKKTNNGMGINGYQVYAQCAENLGLIAGHYWVSQDSVHVQLTDRKISDVYSLKEVDERMEMKWKK